MKVHVLPWDGRVEGLGDARGLPLGDGRLGDTLEVALASATRVEQPLGAWVFEGGTVIGPHLLAALAELRPERDTRVRIGGRTGGLLEEIALGEDPVCVRWIAGTGDEVEVELDPDESDLAVPMPGGEDLPLSDRFALRVRHPIQLLWANLLSLPPRLWRRLAGTGLVAAWRIAAAVLRTRSGRHEDLARALTRREAGAWVHPTATVEASVLGPGARVGAGAVVRGSILGADARVEALAICEGSVLAQGAVVQRQALCRYCVLAEGAMLGGAAQLAVFGPRSALKRGSYGMDQGLGQDVRVRVGEGLRRAPLGLAGPTLGAGTLVGSGVWIAPGRMLPPGMVVLGPDPLRNPEPPDHDGPYRVVDGRLV